MAAAEVEREVQDEVEEGLREVEADSGIVVEREAEGEVEREAEDSVEEEVAAATRISQEQGRAVEEGAHNCHHWR